MGGETFNLLSAELTCGKTEMVLVLPVASFPNVDLTELQLNSPTCPISYNSTHLTASVSLDGCGTKTVVTRQISAFTPVRFYLCQIYCPRKLHERTVMIWELSTGKCPAPQFLGIFKIQLKVNDLFSSKRVQSWFTSTPCKACFPPPWSEKNQPSSYPWRAASPESRPRGQSTDSAFPWRGRSLVRWPSL